MRLPEFSFLVALNTAFYDESDPDTRLISQDDIVSAIFKFYSHDRNVRSISVGIQRDGLPSGIITLSLVSEGVVEVKGDVRVLRDVKCLEDLDLVSVGSSPVRGISQRTVRMICERARRESSAANNETGDGAIRRIMGSLPQIEGTETSSTLILSILGQAGLLDFQYGPHGTTIFTDPTATNRMYVVIRSARKAAADK